METLGGTARNLGGRILLRIQGSKWVFERALRQLFLGHIGPQPRSVKLAHSTHPTSKTMSNVRGGVDDNFFNLVISYFEGLISKNFIVGGQMKTVSILYKFPLVGAMFTDLRTLEQ